MFYGWADRPMRNCPEKQVVDGVTEATDDSGCPSVRYIEGGKIQQPAGVHPAPQFPHGRVISGWDHQ